jgi:cell division protein FtsN
VQIPDAELAAQVRQPVAPVETQAGDQLFLQAGAFSDPRRAEEVKAAIAFSGMVARVEPTQTASGQTVHRVMLGPFANSQALDQAKSSLASNGIQAIALRNPAR